MAALTATRLRGLVSLYRRDVRGAAAQLDDLVGHPDLRSIVGDIDLTDPTDRVERLACWVERSRNRRALERAEADRAKAEQLARNLAAQAVSIGPDTLELEPSVLAELVDCRSYDWLVFDHETLCGVDRDWLRGFFRKCKRVEDLAVELGPNQLQLRYRTRHGRARLRLWLRRAPAKAVPLLIECSRGREPSVDRAAETIASFSRTVSSEASLATPDHAQKLTREAAAPTLTAESAAVGPSEHELDPTEVTSALECESDLTTTPVPRPVGSPGFLRHLLDAASEAIR